MFKTSTWMLRVRSPPESAPTSAPRRTFNVHDGSVTTLIYSADGSLAASGSEDTSVIIKRLESHGDIVSTLAFPRDNRALASASQDELIFIWNVVRVGKLKELTPSSAVHPLVYTPDSSKLIVGASDGKWDATTYSPKKVTAVVTFIVFSHDGQRMAPGGTESLLHLDTPNPDRFFLDLLICDRRCM